MKLAVLGDPVAHSRSPAIHEAALRAAGIAGSYVARQVDHAGMAAAVAEIASGDLDGANVTMPHKRLAASLVAACIGPAARAGAVNTLVCEEPGRVVGYLTDIDGVRDAWPHGPLPANGPVLILGAGGAAAAALLALEGRPLHISARQTERAAGMLRRLGVEADVVVWGSGVPGAVVVNATPLGMRGEALPGDALAAAAGLFEMTYGEDPSPALVEMQRRRLPTVDGLEMLLAQAMASFTLWTGIPAPEAAMRAALR